MKIIYVEVKEGIRKRFHFFALFMGFSICAAKKCIYDYLN